MRRARRESRPAPAPSARTEIGAIDLRPTTVIAGAAKDTAAMASRCQAHGQEPASRLSTGLRTRRLQG